MRRIRYIQFSVIALFLLTLSTTVNAEQIQLANGQFIQGEVIAGSSDDKGFSVKLTSNGGVVKFRWSQVSESEKRRILKLVDPDADLNLEVYVEGTRVTLESGLVLECKELITEGSYYRIKNIKYPKGKRIAQEDVAEDGIDKKVMIDARVVLTPEEILTKQENEVSTNGQNEAKNFYYLSKLAEHLGEYKRAAEYVEKCLTAAPTSNLQNAATSLQADLKELLRQEALLSAIDQARELVRDDQYQIALNLLNTMLKDNNPTGVIKERFESVIAEFDLEFTIFVINEWHEQVSKQISAWLSDRENKKATFGDASAFVRGELKANIIDAISIMVKQSDPKDIEKRFRSRLKMLQDNDETFELVHRKSGKWRKASFGKDGWYGVVGGNLPNGGREAKKQNQNQNSNRNPRGNNGRNNSDRNGRNNNGRDGQPDSNDWNASITDKPAFQRRREAEKREESGEGEKKEGGEEEGANEEDIRKAIEEIIKKQQREAQEKREEEERRNENRRTRKKYDKDDPKWKLPEGTKIPSLEEFWEKARNSKKKKWLIAYYVRTGRDMYIMEEDYWNIKKYW